MVLKWNSSFPHAPSTARCYICCITIDLLPSSFGVFSYECNYALFYTSVIQRRSFTHTDSNLVDFPLRKSCCQTKTSLSAITCVPAQAINPILSKCKHSWYHHMLYLFLLPKLNSIFFKVLLPAPSFCLHETDKTLFNPTVDFDLWMYEMHT